MAKGKFVALRHKTKSYRGKDYDSYVGSIKVGSQEILLSINADGIDPAVIEGEYKGNTTHSIFVNLHKIDPRNKQKGKRNEL